jgi:hypothetical protein
MPNGLANSTGAIAVWAKAGRDSSKTPNLFQYAQAPTITAFTAAAGAGAWAQITGANLVGVSGVNFGGIKADSVLNVSPTLVLAKVASAARVGKLTFLPPEALLNPHKISAFYERPRSLLLRRVPAQRVQVWKLRERSL